MAGHIFISYKKEDEDAAGVLVEALRRDGFEVWWDKELAPEAPWEATIEANLQAALAVLVLWSPAAVQSENVRAEARWARTEGKLLQVFIRHCAPPLFFGERQGVDLSNWNGDRTAKPYLSLVAGLRAVLAGEKPDKGLGFAPKPKPKSRAWLVGASAVALALSAAGAYWTMRRETPSSAPPSTDRQAALLALVAGDWGDLGCRTRATYSVDGDKIEARWPNYLSTGHVVSVRADTLLSETLLPVERRGRLVELTPTADTMIVHDRTDNTQVILERCP